MEKAVDLEAANEKLQWQLLRLEADPLVAGLWRAGLLICVTCCSFGMQAQIRGAEDLCLMLVRLGARALRASSTGLFSFLLLMFFSTSRWAQEQLRLPWPVSPISAESLTGPDPLTSLGGFQEPPHWVFKLTWRSLVSQGFRKLSFP